MQSSSATSSASGRSGDGSGTIDASGWTVATSGSSSSASRAQSLEGSQLMLYIVMGIVAIAVIGYVKKKKK
jgi:hypothetical protein